MKVQRNEAAWTKIRFEPETQSTKAYKNWAKEVLSVLAATDI